VFWWDAAWRHTVGHVSAAWCHFCVEEALWAVSLHRGLLMLLHTVAPSGQPLVSNVAVDYEQSLCFLIVCRERSEKNRPRESWPHESCCLRERRKKGTTDKASAFDLSRPRDFMVFISNLINRNPIISLIFTACQFWSVIAFIAVKH